MSLRAKALYPLFKVKYNPLKNDGLVRLSQREVKRKKWPGFGRHEAIAATIQELINRGWLELAEPGGLLSGAPAYRLTFRFDEYGKR
ncbi:MAG: hypothetical protein A2V67_12595 [Deltaproteobacteria bacterium RBG_13_61_14]|nr:MAG: hypothetical protein A2V67_12595 [Deltaproteobacteria bacterium RBG_13_61_14]